MQRGLLKLALAGIGFGLCAMAWAQPGKSPINAEYSGKIFRDGEYLPVVTTLQTDEEGKTTGRYRIESGEQKIDGEIPYCMERPYRRELICSWRDSGDSGSVILVMAEDLNSFKASWSYAGSSERLQWNGVRQ